MTDTDRRDHEQAAREEKPVNWERFKVINAIEEAIHNVLCAGHIAEMTRDEEDTNIHSYAMNHLFDRLWQLQVKWDEVSAKDESEDQLKTDPSPDANVAVNDP